MLLSVALFFCSREKVPEYHVQGGPLYRIPFVFRAPEGAAAVSLVGNFNAGVPFLWFMRQTGSGCKLYAHLTNGRYTYRYAVRFADGRIRFYYDSRYLYAIDDGWKPGSRDPRDRSCLHYFISGFCVSNGSVERLRGGLRVKGRKFF